MKLVLAALLAFAALGACAGAAVKLSAATSGLDDEETAIVNGFLELVQGVVRAGGDISQMEDVLNEIKGRVETKLRKNGPRYLEKLAQTLSSVHISEDNVNSLIKSINEMATKDGVNLSRGKRSPSPKKKKWGKKKKGKKGKGGCG